MGRASKLFPLPGRKSTGVQSTSILRDNNQPPLSKAERLLGASGLQDAARHQLSPRADYMSLTPSISEAGEDADHDDFSNPHHFGMEPLPLRLADLQHNDTAQTHRLSNASSYARSATSQYARRIKGSWSSATLRTHYDTTQQPHDLPHSALQPGHSYDRNSRRMHSGPIDSHSMHRPRTASAASSTAYDSQDSMDHATALPDITRMYPKPSYMSQSPLASPRRTDFPSSPAHSSKATMRFPGVGTQARPVTSTGALNGPAPQPSKGLRGRLSVDHLPSSIKLFSRRQHQHQPSLPEVAVAKPQPQPRRRGAGSKNWWDTFPVDVDGSDAESEHDANLVTPTMPPTPVFPANSRIVSSTKPANLKLIPNDHLDPGYSIRKLGSSHEIISAKSSTTLRSPRSQTSRGSRPSSRMVSNDLHATSVLSTSSSSEAESEGESDDGQNISNAHRLRDSIASEIDVHHVGQAQAMRVKPMRRPSADAGPSDRRPSIASETSNLTNTDSSSIRSAGNTPSYLAVPNRSTRSRKSGHTRQPSSIPEDSDLTHVASPTSPTSPPASLRSFSAPLLNDNRKMMAVTEEEEALLELMRRKRADKAAQRDSGLASIKSSSTTRSARPFSNLSATSSILDSFPLSRSQRSSLLASRTTTQHTSVDETHNAKDLTPSSERGRKRQSIATTATDNSYYSIDSRLESPTRLKYAFTPHLSLASLDALQTSSSRDETTVPTPESLDSPTTPLTRRGSGDVAIHEASSKRNSSASYAYGDHALSTNAEDAPPQDSKPNDKLRRKTTSGASTKSAPLSSPSSETHPKPLEKLPPLPRTLSAPISPSSSDESHHPSSDTHAKRASTCSSSSCGHFSHSGSAGYSRNSVGYGAGIGTRCSVSEDVLAAWGSLGGWRDPPAVKG